MKEPDQQLFDEIFSRLSDKGLSVFDFLPPLGTKYPFIVMGDTHTIPTPTKSKLYGMCTTTIHVWGDDSDRKKVSDLIANITFEVSKIKQIENRQWFMQIKESDTEILKDNSTNENLYHGIINIYFKFI